MTDKEKIRAEIVRHLKEDACDDEIAVYNELLSFIDSMQEEPVSDSETVETQNKEVYMKPHSEPIYLGIGGIPIDAPKYLCKEEPVSEDLDVIAREYAGIPCDAPKDLTYCVHDKKAKYDAVLFGAQWQKQRLMQNAIKGLIVCDDELTHGYKDIAMSIPDNLQVNDEVKLIIIKED